MCHCCHKECKEVYYHCDKQSLVCYLCSTCFLEENFSTGINQSDFEKKQLAGLSDEVFNLW